MNTLHQMNASLELAAMCQFKPITGSDFQIVQEALKAFRDIAHDNQYGGLGREYLLAQAALQCLDRIEQPELICSVDEEK